jgi:phenylalanyl-tRNA synthetase beta chain
MKISIKALYYLLNKKINISKLVEKLNILGFESNIIENYLDINIPYNRHDCNNFIGILNEIKNFDKNFSIELFKNENQIKISDNINIKIVNKNFCPIYSYKIIDNLNIEKNIPNYIKETLKLNDINSVNNLVDILNYSTIITGQPFHCYDLNCLDKEINIIKTETVLNFKTINELEIKLPKNIFVIKSKKEIISVPGIIGSFNSKVSEHTKKILLESAFFDCSEIKNIEDKLNISTDASKRFINKIDFNLTFKALNYVSNLIVKVLKSNVVCTGFKLEKKNLPQNKKIKINKKFFFTLLNNNLSNDVFSNCIDNIFLEKKKSKNFITFYIPNNRKDLEINENIFSEILKLYGYNNVLPIKFKNTFSHKNIDYDFNYKTSYFLKNMGFNEIISYSFVDSKVENFLNYNNFIYIKNPISEKMDVMRQTLIQGLMKAVIFNVNRKNNKLKLFEIGSVYKQCENKKFKSENTLSLVITNKINKDDDFFYMKNIVTNLVKNLFNIEEIDLIEKKYTFFNKKISLSILYNNEEFGCIGLIKKELLNFFDLKQEIYYCSLSLDKINVNFSKFFEDISKFPYITRDLSLIFKTHIFYKDIINFIKNLKINNLTKISFLDFYKIDDINKSLTLRFKFCSKKRTLLDAEISDSMEIINKNLKIKFNIEIKKQ